MLFHSHSQDITVLIEGKYNIITPYDTRIGIRLRCKKQEIFVIPRLYTIFQALHSNALRILNSSNLSYLLSAPIQIAAKPRASKHLLVRKTTATIFMPRNTRKAHAQTILTKPMSRPGLPMNLIPCDYSIMSRRVSPHLVNIKQRLHHANDAFETVINKWPYNTHKPVYHS